MGIKKTIAVELKRMGYPSTHPNEIGMAGIYFPDIEINWEEWRRICDQDVSLLPDTHFNAVFQEEEGEEGSGIGTWHLNYATVDQSFEAKNLEDLITELVTFMESDAVVKKVGDAAITFPR